MSTPDASMADDHVPVDLSDPLHLRCGVILKNRIAKAAMSDSLGDGGGDSTAAQARLYARWARGGVGLSIVGEVQGDPRFPEKPGNLVIGAGSDGSALTALADAGRLAGSSLWAQIGHAGALADPGLSIGRGPSTLDIDGFHCDAFTPSEIDAMPARFAEAAGRLRAIGFGGVELHAAHGFLLSQFLSPLFNRRTDAYGGDLDSRCRLVIESIAAIRRAVGPEFPIGIKINSSDGLIGGLTEDDALVVVERLDATSVDLIDISGGTYFPGAKATSDRPGNDGAYFVEFARRARERTSLPLMVTGGFKTRSAASAALASRSADIVGLARALVLDPELPSGWLQGPDAVDPVFPHFEAPPPGGITAWYTMRLTALADEAELEMSVNLAAAVELCDARDADRRPTWRARFDL